MRINLGDRIQYDQINKYYNSEQKGVVKKISDSDNSKILVKWENSDRSEWLRSGSVRLIA